MSPLVLLSAALSLLGPASAPDVPTPDAPAVAAPVVAAPVVAAPVVPRSQAVPPAPAPADSDSDSASGGGSTGDAPPLELPPDPPPPSAPLEPEVAQPEPTVVEVPQPAPEIEAPPPEPELDLAELFPPPEAKPVASEDRPWFAARVFIGLVGLLALAYLGGHPFVQRLERKMGVSRVVAAGFPFLALGLLAHKNGILADDVLDHMRPILHLALGWIGLVIGMRIELGKLSSLPRGAISIIGIGTGLPLGFIVAGCATLLFVSRALEGETLLDPLILRDALVLGAAGSIAADTETLRYGARKASAAARRTLVQLATLDELAALVGLAFLNAYFRPSGGDVTWQLPSTAWLFVTFGLALVVGVVVYAIVRLPATSTESIALLLGSVAFVAGIASALHLSPLVVCFVVGMLLANFPGEYKQRLNENLARLEMPIYLVFLIVAGAMWSPNLLGWIAMLVLLVARFVGRWAGGRIVWRKVDADLPIEARRSLVFAPMGTLPIAVAVNAALLYPDGELPTILTATIGGAIFCELALALLWRRDETLGHTGPAEVVR